MESNHRLNFRRVLFYPLNYRGRFVSLDGIEPPPELYIRHSSVLLLNYRDFYSCIRISRGFRRENTLDIIIRSGRCGNPTHNQLLRTQLLYAIELIGLNTHIRFSRDLSSTFPVVIKCVKCIKLPVYRKLYTA